MAKFKPKKAGPKPPKDPTGSKGPKKNIKEKINAKGADPYRVALAQRAQSGAADVANMKDFLKQQGVQGLTGQGQGSKWGTQTAAQGGKAVAPVSVDAINFDTYVFDGTPAEKDKAKRRSETNTDTAKRMAKALEKIADNTKEKKQQDIGIKKEAGSGGKGLFGKGIEKVKGFKDAVTDFAGSIWDKVIGWLTNLAIVGMAWNALKTLGGIVGGVFKLFGKMGMAGFKMLKFMVMAPLKFAKAAATGIWKAGGFAWKATKAAVVTGAKVVHGAMKGVAAAATIFGKGAAAMIRWSVLAVNIQVKFYLLFLDGVKNLVKQAPLSGHQYWVLT